MIKVVRAREPLRVLIVEDSPADAELILVPLERAGFAVSADIVATRQELTVRLAASRYDVVLSDYRLPGWTAMDALALLRHDGHGTPLIIVTGVLSDAQAVDCINQGAADCVIKDHLARLPIAVRRALAERGLREGLRASEERYRMLFDRSPLPTWVFDHATHAFLAVNEAAVQHYGYSREEFLALRIEELRPPDDVPLLHHVLATRPAELHTAGPWRHRKKDGTLIAVEISAYDMTWDGRPAELVVVHDISQRQGAEQALEERTAVAELGAEVGMALTRGRTLREILQGCCDALVRNLDAAFARIWTLNEPDQMLELHASAGLYTHLDGPHSRVAVGQYKIGLIASERQPHITNSVIGDPRVGDQEWAKREGMVAFAGYPLLVQDRLVGVVAMFARHPFTEFTRDALATIADSIAVAIERVRAEEAFRESETRFRQLGENVKEVFFMMDGQLREMLYINPAYEQLWGRSCRSLHDNPRSFLDPVPPEDRERVGVSMARAQAGEDPGEVEFRVIRQGEVRWVLAHPIPLRNEQGDVIRIIGTAMDITNRKKAEDALRQSEQRSRTLFETVNLIVLGLDARGKVEYVNPFLLALTGYTRAEMLGEDWVERFLPETLRQEGHRVFQELHEQELHIHHQNPIRTKAGKERMITWHNTRLKDTQGRGAGTLSIGEDVTEHLKLEQQFRQAQKMEAVGQLAAGVAHDFNNLLTAILGSAELLLESMPAHAPEREDVEEIHQAGRRAADLTRQLLAFSRQQVLAPRVLDLNALVTNMEKLLQRLIGEDVALRTTLASRLGVVRADPGQLEQVIVNLAVNARDAMPKGGQLTIETSNVVLDEGYADVHFPAKPGSFVLLTVTDTGTGMDAETKSHMFEPFFTTKGMGKGTGLGLATLYGIVKQSDGYVWVYSEPGHGTAFKIYLPRVTDAAEIPPVATESAAPRGTETVLVVEDDEQVRRLTRKMLEARGHTVLVAANGIAALDLLEANPGPIDLLVTDVVMPGMNGRELAERVAVLRPTMKVLYLSGYTDDAIVRHGVLQAGIAFLQKPFAADTLVRKVREVLDGTR